MWTVPEFGTLSYSNSLGMWPWISPMTVLNRNRVHWPVKFIRDCIAQFSGMSSPFGGEVGLDESHFLWPRSLEDQRGGGLDGRTTVFGFLTVGAGRHGIGFVWLPLPPLSVIFEG